MTGSTPAAGLLQRAAAALRRAAMGGLLAVTAGAVALSLLPLAARFSYAAEMASHFRLQYLALLTLLAVPLVLLRRRYWSIAVGVAMAVSFAPMAGYWLGVMTPAEPAHAVENGDGDGARRLRVMTANLEARGHPPAKLTEIVRRQQPDVLVLTEFTPRWERNLEPFDELFAYRYEMARRDPWGLAVFSRHEIVSAEQLDLGESKAIEARVRMPDGEIVTVIGVHLRSPTGRGRAAARNRQLELLAAHRASVAGPLVVTGDFNIKPYSPYFRDWLSATGLTDARRGFGLDVSWPTFLPVLGIPIDHCAVSGHFHVTDHRKLPAFGSDHYPILAELVLQ
jgi:endonuclease/exonuclease/phosphatase (EEP) superfamily protein YafD